MKREEVEKILREAGWRKTKGDVPSNVVDYQRSKPYNRILLYPDEVKKLTRDRLEYLMKTPVEMR